MAIFGVDMMGGVCVAAMAGQAMSSELDRRGKASSSLRARCFGVGVHVKGVARNRMLERQRRGWRSGD